MPKRKKYVLDLSECEQRPKWWPTEIPIRKGRYDHKWDLVEEEMRPEIVKRMRGKRIRKGKYYLPPIAYERPMGFTFLPHGAKIKEVN